MNVLTITQSIMKRMVVSSLILPISIIEVFAQDAAVVYKNTDNSTVTIETDLVQGSGFFVNDSIIATNYHVVKGANDVHCYTKNSTIKYEIEGYVAVDTSVDLIFLKVSGLRRTPITISGTPLEIGQKVYVIGSPKGLPATISDGIISAFRDFDSNKLIQITAPISPGSSGGPVMDAKGELIGVSVSQLKEGQNLNFAIPKSYVVSMLKNKELGLLPLSALNENRRYIELGSTYYRQRNYDAALKCFEKAADQDEAEAQYNVGVMYYHGESVPLSYNKALQWFIKASTQQYAEAQKAISEMYKNGEGVPQDYDEAKVWCRKAADQEIKDAQYTRGLEYYYGTGVSQDYTKAMEWYRKAADQEDAAAQYMIGTMYYYGNGVSQDTKEALNWLIKAQENGSKQAISLLEKMQ